MSTHSPGPWHYYESYHAIFNEQTGAHVVSFRSSLDPTVADGVLMAASIDLLEACELARSQLSCDCGIPCCNTCETIRQLDAAIQKARGEQ